MKRKYCKPTVYAEELKLSTGVMKTCSMKPTDEDGSLFIMPGYVLFNNDIAACTDEPDEVLYCVELAGDNDSPTVFAS